MKQLDKGSKAITDGDLTTRVNIRSKDELGALGIAFNVMAKSIQDKIYALHGDYFLNSLLLEPLHANHSSSDLVSVEFFLKQKMGFQFRKWEKEIGGDICFSHNINLNGKEYIVFFNADAMGKSIQGAGGAIVLGAVFGSIVGRTRFLSKEKATYPELQSFFEKNLRKDAKLFNEYHALIVEHGKRHCRAKPVCRGCPLGRACKKKGVKAKDKKR